MDEGRDNKGRFTKGNKEGRKFRSCDGSAAAAQEASSTAQVRNGIIAKALRRALLGKNPDTGNIVLDDLIEGTVRNTIARGVAGDLRVLADVLGELEQKVDIGEGVTVIVKSQGEAKKLEDIANLGV